MLYLISSCPIVVIPGRQIEDRFSRDGASMYMISDYRSKLSELNGLVSETRYHYKLFHYSCFWLSDCVHMQVGIHTHTVPHCRTLLTTPRHTFSYTLHTYAYNYAMLHVLTNQINIHVQCTSPSQTRHCGYVCVTKSPRFFFFFCCS